MSHIAKVKIHVVEADEVPKMDLFGKSDVRGKNKKH